MLRRADIKVLGLKLFIYKKVGTLKHMTGLLIKTNEQKDILIQWVQNQPITVNKF